MGKFDDSGIFSKNTKRRSENAPIYTGVMNFSAETVDRLVDAIRNHEDAKVYIAIWRSRDNPDQFTIRIEKPMDGRRGGGGRRSPDRGSYQTVDRGDRHRDARDDRYTERSRTDESRYERREPSRREDTEAARGWEENNDDPWGDDVPF